MIIEMLKVSRELRKQSNMSYTHINLDAGAAIKVFMKRNLAMYVFCTILYIGIHRIS